MVTLWERKVSAPILQSINSYAYAESLVSVTFQTFLVKDKNEIQSDESGSTSLSWSYLHRIETSRNTSK
jgi:hypothetical protein